jgi:hypothetical protein
MTVILTQSRDEATVAPVLGVVSFYLSAVFTFLKSERSRNFATSNLLDSILFAMCVYDKFRNTEEEGEYNDEDIWSLTIHTRNPHVKTVGKTVFVHISIF